MKKVLSIFLLFVFSFIQVGAVGMTLHKNKCSKNDLISFSLFEKGCCCKKIEANKERPCCSSKIKSCCSSNSGDKEKINNNCCDSESLHFKVQSSEYETNLETNNQKVNVIVFNYIIKTNFSSQFTILLKRNYSFPDDPPLESKCDKRVFIQSFQI